MLTTRTLPRSSPPDESSTLMMAFLHSKLSRLSIAITFSANVLTMARFRLEKASIYLRQMSISQLYLRRTRTICDSASRTKLT